MQCVKTVHFTILSCVIAMLSGCIGTDVIDDLEPESPNDLESLMVNPGSVGLQVGDTASMSGVYTNSEGIVSEVDVMWSSSNENVATVDADGLITAVSTGSADINVSYNDLSTSGVVNVVDDTVSVAQITIQFQSNMVAIGDTLKLTGVALNVMGAQIEGLTLSWNSSNESVATIDEEGNLIGLADGTTQITVNADGVSSGSFEIIIQSTSRDGTFEGLNGYGVDGTCQLKIDGSGDLILEFNNDFTVSSFGAAIYVYMSNQSNGVAGGVEIQQLSTTGAQSFNLSSMNPALELTTYNYVIIHCKPFNIPFGRALLE